MTVLFTNPLGITIERTDYKNRSKVKVSNNGYNLKTYRFNNVECFESPYISWQNLDQCNGWNTSEEYLHTAVQNGTKLFASIVHTDDVSFEATDDVVVDTRKHGWLKDHSYTHISRKGCLSDYYDLDAVFAHYSRLGIYLTGWDKDEIREFCQVELSVFGTDDRPMDYLNNTEISHIIVTGLLLGYPLETTTSIIEECGL